jgi:hypothetical protein
MPYYKETVRHSKTVFVDYDEELLRDVIRKRWNPYEEQPIRDVAELFGVMRRVVNSDTRRLRAVRAILREHKR